jgi:ATP-dependent RNA helicase DDX24/MAK5
MLHAQQQQRQRLKALDRFRADESGVLVATDVAARGLHIPEVASVIQYQLPPTADTYIHRAGRTGRGDARGACISLVVPGEARRFAALHGVLGRGAPGNFPVDSAVIKDVHARVRLAQRIDEVERGDRKQTAEERWLERNAAAIGMSLTCCVLL